MEKLKHIRRNYNQSTLLEKNIKSDPYAQFKLWFNQNLKTDIIEPTAVTLASATSKGRPSARVVLLKSFAPDLGFMFFTNYESKKAQDLKENPHAALLFYWPSLERQVRVEGKIKKVSRAISEQYFKSRPRASQLGAWTSEQSKVIPDRTFLEGVLKQLESYFKDEATLPLPPFWGGYTLVPTYLEFWQGRKDRLHDRITYRLFKGQWVIERLAP